MASGLCLSFKFCGVSVSDGLALCTDILDDAWAKVPKQEADEKGYWLVQSLLSLLVLSCPCQFDGSM